MFQVGDTVRIVRSSVPQWIGLVGTVERIKRGAFVLHMDFPVPGAPHFGYPHRLIYPAVYLEPTFQCREPDWKA